MGIKLSSLRDLSNIYDESTTHSFIEPWHSERSGV